MLLGEEADTKERGRAQLAAHSRLLPKYTLLSGGQAAAMLLCEMLKRPCGQLRRPKSGAKGLILSDSQGVNRVKCEVKCYG
ncbi:hypothetical protein Naga_100117g3 [Nannochloropsis gaditana]|uniref:Uncharacterized protein n=1 Tax=Nannochloropsis gaditana TaxID=72520 RepID=W7TVJ4_9STRA|nr:hypothetical protein Naga_100117g3 [Nannochloropsis gaditana]